MVPKLSHRFGPSTLPGDIPVETHLEGHTFSLKTNTDCFGDSFANLDPTDGHDASCEAFASSLSVMCMQFHLDFRNVYASLLISYLLIRYVYATFLFS